MSTEIADNVYQGLKLNQTTDVHVFARRGPAQIKFTPMELRELSHSPSVDVIVHLEGFEIDEASQAAINGSKGTRLVVDTLLKYVEAEPTGALADLDTLPQPEIRDPQGILEHLAGRGATVIDSDGWARLDAHEIALGEAVGRERIKIVPREDMIRVAKA